MKGRRDVFRIQEIMELLPHRYPFLLVDRIVEWDPGKRIVGIKNVTINEPFFQGHFPSHPIMPGVLIVEAPAQTGGVLRARGGGGGSGSPTSRGSRTASSAARSSPETSFAWKSP